MYTQFLSQHSFAYNSTTQDLSLQLSPISVCERGGGQLSVDALSESLTVIPHQDLFSDFEDHSRWNSIWDVFRFASLDPTILLDRFFIPSDNCSAIVYGFSQGTASVVSDGYFCSEPPIGPSGTSSVIVSLEIDCNQNLFSTGTNWVTGPKDYQSSYWSELAGIIAALTIIDAIIWLYNITEGSITISLDSKLALEQSQSTAPLSSDQKSFDYLQIIWNWIQLYPLTFKFRHVIGHQTDHILYNNLDWWGTMNNKMDERAKMFMSVCTTIVPVRVRLQPTLYLEKWSLSLDGTKLTCVDQNRLYESLHGNITLKYWYKKYNVSWNPEDIMWEKSWLARRRSTMGLCQLDSELLCNQCCLAKTLYNRQYKDTQNYPVCNSECEDRYHLLTCPDSLATNIFKYGTNNLKKNTERKREKFWIAGSYSWSI